MYRKLIFAATLLTFIVVVLGAYVRLTDAGLGCPDWPGCYGHLGAPETAAQQARALELFPGSEIHVGKAWKEMIHRYFAGALGLLVLGIAALSWKREHRAQTGRLWPTLLVAIVGFQAVLGMWTVTMLLKPVIVTAHLLGGMTTLALLALLAAKVSNRPVEPLRQATPIRPLALAGLIVLVGQIFLGGWTSTNYAALACTGFPECSGQWLPANLDFHHGFSFLRELGRTYDGQYLSHEALQAIHWVHRVGALITFLLLGHLAGKLIKQPTLRSLGAALIVALAAQVALGIGSVLMHLPLHMAVAHNAGAATLLVVLVVINFRLSQASRM